MTIVICLDNNSGMSFDGKRQSKDRLFRKFLLDKAEKEKSQISMTPYSYEQFKADERDELIDVKESFSFDESCVFLERKTNIPWEKVDTLIICCWNRDYPADEYFSIPIGVECRLLSTEEIPEATHLLTVETYAVQTQKWYESDRRELNGKKKC